MIYIIHLSIHFQIQFHQNDYLKILGNIWKKFIRKYPEDNFYILSLNPIYKPLHYKGNTITNKKIKEFNKQMKKMIRKSNYRNTKFINTYKNIFKKEKIIHEKSACRYALKYRKLNIRHMRESSSFQLHYSSKIDKKIYKYVNQFIQNNK